MLSLGLNADAEVCWLCTQKLSCRLDGRCREVLVQPRVTCSFVRMSFLYRFYRGVLLELHNLKSNAITLEVTEEQPAELLQGVIP